MDEPACAWKQHLTVGNVVKKANEYVTLSGYTMTVRRGREKKRNLVLSIRTSSQGDIGVIECGRYQCTSHTRSNFSTA